MNWLKKLLMLCLIVALSVFIAACSEQGPAESVGEQIDEAVESVQDALDPAGPAEQAGEAIDEVIEDVEEAGEQLDEATEEAEEGSQENS